LQGEKEEIEEKERAFSRETSWLLSPAATPEVLARLVALI
jgi:hypothetical protein